VPVCGGQVEEPLFVRVLLEEVLIQFHFDGRGRAEAPVHFDKDLDLRAHGLPDGGDQVDRTDLLLARKFECTRAEGVHL